MEKRIRVANNGAMSRILLVDDDRELCQLLTEYLEPEEFEVEAVHDGAAAIAAIAADEPALMVLDIMLPGLSGVEVLRRVRDQSNVPILMLTARGDDVDRIVGLEMGADDYLPKPCNPRELLARMRAVLRRAAPGAGGPRELLRVDDLELNPGTRRLTVAGRETALTSTEFSLLEILMGRAGEVVSKEELSSAGLGRPLGRYDRSIDMHISNLRRKLGEAGDGSSRMETVRGIGYLLRA